MSGLTIEMMRTTRASITAADAARAIPQPAYFVIPVWLAKELMAEVPRVRRGTGGSSVRAVKRRHHARGPRWPTVTVEVCR